MPEKSGAGGSGPENIRSLVDRRKKQEAQKREEFKLNNPDLIDHSEFEKPEKKRRQMCDAKAVEILKTIAKDPRCTVEALAAQHKALAERNVKVEEVLEISSHEKWIQDPAYNVALAEEYLHEVDTLAADIANVYLESASEPPAIGREKPKLWKMAPTEYLIQLVRDFNRDDPREYSREIMDAIFEYRRRRANSEL